MTKNNIDISLNKDYENIIIKDNDNQINNKIEYDNFMDNEIEDNNIHEIINTIYNNKNNKINFDNKDIKILDIQNNVISIKNEKDLKNNFNIIKTIPDGNCFYEAFLKSLNIYNELLKYYSHDVIIKKFRTIAAGILKLNYDNLTVVNFIESNNLTLDRYYENIKNNEWADDIIISLISKYYGIETRIIRYDKVIKNISSLNYGNCSIWLLFEYYSKNSLIETKNHYSGLIPKNLINLGDEKSLTIIKNNILRDLINQNDTDKKFRYKKNDFINYDTNINNNNNCLFVAFCNILGINSCFSKSMRYLIKETLINMYKLNNENKEILKHAQNIINENHKGNMYDIEAFSLLTEFNIIILNDDFSIDKNINKINTDDRATVYLIQNIERDHIEALIPKNTNLYINYEFYSNMSKIINDKIILKYNEINNMNNKIINESMIDNNSKANLKQIKKVNNKEELKIDNNVNKTVAENIKCKNIINSNKVTNFLNHDYAIKFKSEASPIFTIKEYLKYNNDEIIYDKNLIKFSEFCKNFNFKNDKTDIVDLKNNEFIKNHNIIIDIDIHIKDFITKYKLPMEVIRNIGPCIDLKCSGNNFLDNKIYRVFNSLFELRDHYRTKHNKLVNQNSVIINYKNNNFKLVLKNTGNCNEHYYIEEKYIKNVEGIINYNEYSNNKKKNKKKIEIKITIILQKIKIKILMIKLEKKMIVIKKEKKYEKY